MKVDLPEIIRDCGLDGLEGAVAHDLSQHLQGALEYRVGSILAGRLSNQQLEEFDQIVTREDDDTASEWLLQHAPDYREVVAKQVEILKAELVERRHEILNAVADRG